MWKRLRNCRKAFVLFAIIFLSALKSYGTHIFGVDLYYTYVSGSTYTVHLVIYGDCSGAAFPSLSTAIPVVKIYNGNTFVSNVNLAIQAPVTGIEVTPVCPADSNNTTCKSLSNPIPGVKKFVYTANVALTGTSAVWRFLFEGNMGTGSSAGRSNSITNVVIPGAGSPIQLVDTLNNTTFDNSNAVYTTIPTPFFCLDIPANFNPGAVDPNGDSLVFHLVPAIDANTGVSVSYIFPYTAVAPLGVTTGTFSFSSTTGQLAFTPNILQKALVVYNVEEYSGGVLRGTSQREMTVVVITPCTDVPPIGVLSSASAGATITSSSSLSVCSATGAYNFHINPTDPDLDNITMTVSGLPAGATFNIVGNGTTAPLGTFNWTTTGVAPGNYIFYINYIDNGCPLSSQQTIAYTITVLAMPTEAYTPVSAATCVSKAVYTVMPGGYTTPWTMSAIASGATVYTVTGVTGLVTDSLSPGTYDIRMANAGGCYVDTTITIAAPILPVPSVSTTPPLCPGGATGTATISATGGLAPYTYAIGSGTYSTSGTFTGLSPVSYVLHVKDANQCEKDTTITIPDASPILAEIEIHKPFCDTFTNGYIVITGFNSTGPFTYAIGSGSYSSGNTFTHLGVGSYTFHIKNGNGCIYDTTLSLTDSVTLSAVFSVANILCNGGTGSVTASGVGGFGSPYTYAYNTGAFSTSDVFTIPTGTYTFHVHDAQSCYFDTSITLTQPTSITITPTIINVACNGTSTGMISVSATGGTPTYTYSIGGGTYGSSGVFSGLPAGTEDLAVQDANGCVYTDTVTITQPAALVLDSVVMHQPTCYGSSNGTISVYATGGVTAYSYANGTGSYVTGRTFSTLPAGVYTMHVKDANGCIKDTTVTLQQPSAIIPAAVVRPSVCHTLSNGKVTLSATGGTPSYTYAVGSGTYSTTLLFSPLAVATYIFHIKDANGCIADTSITITDSLVVGAAFVITPALCYNQASGTITVAGSGGASPYTYALGAGAYSGASVYSGLHAGSDAMHIKDANGCKYDTTVTVAQPALIVPAITITTPSCHGYSDGGVAIAVTGGTPAFTYSFDNSAYTATTAYTALGAGFDSVHIKDANGCIHDTTFTITQPSAIYFGAITFTNISCFNGANGSITVSGTGATPPYTYDVNTGTWQSATLFSALTAGIELIRMQDARGCEIDTNITLTQPDALIIVAADTVNATCPGYKDGSVKLTVTGGTIPYAYSQDNVNFNSSAAFIALPAGTYTCYVKDANNCQADTTVSLLGLPQIIVDSAGVTQPLCFGGTDGAMTLSVTGGVQPLTYSTNPKSTESPIATFTGLAAGIYVVAIKDSRNCIVDTAVIVPQPDSVVTTLSLTPNECKGPNNQGAIVTNVTGGTAPYTYVWSTTPAQTTAAIYNLANGAYTVVVTDANNCTDSLRGDIVYDNCCTPFIPNAFTPNNDGLDDIFRIRAKGDMHIVRFSVYNRFGQEVYSITNTDDLDQGWDGKFNGIYAEIGTYYYYAKIICGNKDNHTIELKGDLTLIR